MTVDELIVRLTLDAAGLKQGAKDAQATADKLATGLGQSAERGEKAQAVSHKRTADSAVAMGKSIAESNTKVSQSFEGILRTGLAFLAIFTGAKTIEDFTRKMTALDAAVGRMAHNVGSTPEQVSALAQAVERSGGTFEGATSAVQGLSDAYQELITTGTNGIMEPLSRLQALGGHSITVGNDWHKTLLQVADDLKVLDKTNPNLADSLGRQILKDPNLANLAKGGSEAILAAEARSREHGVITKEQVEAAQKAQAAWADLSQSVTSFGNTLVTDLEPDITAILGKMDAWIDANKGWVASDIKADIEAFGKTLSDHRDDIKRFGDELLTIVGVAGQIAVAFAAQGPAAQALELFAALIGTRILGPLSLARAALGLGLLTPAAIAAGASAESTPDAETKAKQDQYYKEHPDANRTVFGAIADWWTGKKTGPQESRTKDDRYDPVADHNRDATAAANERLGQGKGFLTDVLNYAKQKLGFGAADSRTKDDIADIAKSTAKTADLLKAQQDTSSGAAVATYGTPTNTGVGGAGAPSLRFGRDGSGGFRRGGNTGGGRNYADTPDGQAHAGAVKGSEGDRAMDAMHYLVEKKGWTPEGAAIAVGNAMQESGVSAAGGANTGGDGGISHQMFQWNNGKNNDTVNGRWARFQQYVKAHGTSINDPHANLDFMDEERKHRSGLEAQWHTQKDLKNAGRLGHLFEGYGDASEGKRVQNARDVLEAYKRGQTAPTASAPVPAGTSAAAITDAEAFAAHQRIVNGSRDGKDKALYDRYLQQQNAPKTPAPVPPTATAAKPAVQHPHQQSIRDALDILRDARKLTHHDSQPLKVSLDRGSLHRFAAEHTAMLNSAQRSALGHGGNVSNVDRRSTSETNIAELHVHSQARDAGSIAKDMHAALIAKREAADKGNYGLA